MAGLKNLVSFAAKFLNMAKSKAKAAKKKSAKPVAKAKAKPVAKKAAKPVEKKAAPKPSAKKKVVAKKAAPKAKAKPVKKVVKKVVKKAVKTAKPSKPAKQIKPVAKKAALPDKPKPSTTSITQLKTQPKKKVNNDMNLRYSDEELKEFKQLIDKKLTTAREELKYLKEALDNHNDNQAGNKAWNMEEGSDTSEMETLMNQISRQHQYIRNLELALVRIENKTYGICRLTGRLIPKERLRVVPHATLSLEAKLNRKPDDASPAAAAATSPPAEFVEGFED